MGFYVKIEQRIRLARINAPELTGNTIRYRDRQAKHARAVAKKFCPEGSEVVLTTEKRKEDIYNRYVAEVFYKDVNISDYLVEQEVAVIDIR